MPGDRPRYLHHRQEAPERITEDKYNFSSLTDVCCGDSVVKDSVVPHKYVKGSLRRHIAFWHSINAYDSVIDVIENGYKIPFIETPPSKFFKNNKSALDHSEFVRETIIDLLKTGRVSETFSPCTVINPLTVSVNASGKKRLILDLRYINQFIWKQKFKLDDWRVMFEYVRKGDFMFVWDLTSGYHHLDLFLSHQQYFGFSFEFHGQKRYFYFTVLMFGVCTGPYIFTKLLRPLVKHWRGRGIKTAVYLDDGAGVSDTFEGCVKQAKQVKCDLQSAGFIINNDKSVWVPCQGLVWLGLFWNLVTGVLEIPQVRLLKVESAIRAILDRLYGVSARTLAHLTGLLISLTPSLGHVTQLMTRHMYFLINDRVNWDAPINVSKCSGLIQELIYWQTNLRKLNGHCTFEKECRIYPIKVYSDSSSFAGAAFVENQNEMVCHRMFTESEKKQSSTARELMAIDLAVKSFCTEFSNKAIQICSDSQNAVSIIKKGSRKEHLHALAMSVFSVCFEHNIQLHVEWIPRGLNQQSDYLSRIVDFGDWRISDMFFHYVNDLWGSLTVDRFANYHNAKLPRFNSRFWNPGSEAVNCFSISWAHEKNYLVPPINLVSRCLRHLLQCEAEGVLITPAWVSAAYWPFLFPEMGKRAAFIVDYRLIKNLGGIIVDGSLKRDSVLRDNVKFVLLAKLDGSRKGLIADQVGQSSVMCHSE